MAEFFGRIGKMNKIIALITILVVSSSSLVFADNSQRIAELRAEATQIQATRYESDKRADDRLNQIVGAIIELQKQDREKKEEPEVSSERPSEEEPEVSSEEPSEE